MHSSHHHHAAEEILVSDADVFLACISYLYILRYFYYHNLSSKCAKNIQETGEKHVFDI
jgi:hypothetical protein